MLKIAVCDDSPLFLELAIKFINKWSEERQFPVSISSYNNGDDLLAANAEERMDIISLHPSVYRARYCRHRLAGEAFSVDPLYSLPHGRGRLFRAERVAFRS